MIFIQINMSFYTEESAFVVTNVVGTIYVIAFFIPPFYYFRKSGFTMESAESVGTDKEKAVPTTPPSCAGKILRYLSYLSGSGIF